MSTDNSKTNNNAFDFLWKDADPIGVSARLPEGGSGVSGFAGQWTCQLVYRFYTAEKLEDYNITPDAKRVTTNGAFCYFHDYEVAAAAAKKLHQEYPPNTVWRWEIPTINIVNLTNDEVRAKFSDVMTQEVTVSTLMSKKNRHELHMVTLPSAVQAMALVAGFIDAPVFNYESLNIDPDHIDDAYQTMMIGQGTDYEKSTLWQARTELWKALGEINPKAYTLNQGKFDATAGYLRLCLGLIYRKTEIHARLVSVPDPRADAVTNAGKHLQLPVVAQVWKDRAALMADLDLEDAAPAVSNGNHANGNELTIPGDWQNYPADWKNLVKEILAPYAGKPKPIIQKELEGQNATLQSTYGATAADFLAWAEHVG